VKVEVVFSTIVASTNVILSLSKDGHATKVISCPSFEGLRMT